MVVINEGYAEKRKHYKKVIPEGGYGYFVGLGFALPIICILGTGPSFPIIFADFLKSKGNEATALSIMVGLTYGSYSLAGCFTNYLFKNYTNRTIGVIGASLYCTGTFGLIFIQNTYQLMFFGGMLLGAGFGLILTASLSSFNSYFVRRRAMVLNIFQTLIGIGGMIYPFLIQKLREAYGMRGTLAILAAISCHSLLGMLLLHPVEWHMKKIEVSVPDEDQQSWKKNSIDTINEETDEDETGKSLMTTDQRNESTSGRKMSIQSRMSYNYNANRRGSAVSLGLGADVLPTEDFEKRNDKKDKKSNKIWQSVVTFLDLTLLKDIVYINIVLGQACALYSDAGFLTLMPLYLLYIGFSAADASFCIFVGAAADLVSRAFLAGFFAFFKFPARHLILISIILIIAGRIAFVTVTDRLSIILIIAFIGFFKTWLHILQPLMFAEYFSQERFPSAHGLFIFLKGGLIFLLSPIAGTVRDKTGNFILSMHCLTGFLVITAVLWTTEIIICKCRSKKELNNIDLT